MSSVSYGQKYYYQIYNLQTTERNDSVCINTYKLTNCAIEVDFDNDLVTVYTPNSIRYEMLTFGNPDDENDVINPNGNNIFICLNDEYMNFKTKMTIKINNNDFGFILFENKKKKQNIRYNVKLVK